ncbi:MAG: LPS assembly lipoprotein LptE [Bacteroidia bacterium]
MKTLRIFSGLILLCLLLQSESCPYDMQGGRKELTDSVTVSVAQFTSTASLAKATLPQTMAEALRDGIQRQTRMKLVPRNGHLNYEGVITGYSVTPLAIQAGGTDQAALNRLTITVSIKYTDKVDEKFNFESSFSRFADFQSSQNLSAVEDQLIKDISEQLVQDILNRTVNAW